jgi:hypothetical protein
MLSMHGSFNGVFLKKIVTLETACVIAGIQRNTFRVRGNPIPELEAQLKLNIPALLILSNQQIEGTLVHYTADLPGGFYEVTIESSHHTPRIKSRSEGVMIT